MRTPGSILRTSLAVAVLAGLGVAAGWWNAERRRHEMLQALQADAARCAVGFVGADTEALSGTRADLGTPAYAAVKDRLMRLRRVDPQVRFVYLFRSTEPQRVIFLADSEPADSKEVSNPGDDYPEAPNSPGLQAILRDHRPHTEGPLHDSFGEWVTGYALVGDPPPPGAPVVILGLDVDASDWNRALLNAALIAAVVAWVGLGLPLGAWLVVRRQREQDRLIHKLSAAVQQSQSGIVITNLERHIEYVNDGIVVQTGYTLAELIGRPIRMFFDADQDARTLDTIRDLLVGGNKWQGEIRIRRKSGASFPARIVASPVRDDGGRIVGFAVVSEDISDYKQAEADLRAARDHAQAGDRAKGEFLAMMSHELRTPLNGIIGFAGLLQETPLSAEQQDYATTIRVSGEALLTLTNELLDFSRIDAGRMQLDPQPCSPRGCVEEAVELLAGRAAEKNLELFIAFDESVPEHIVTDPGRLRQVLVNLVGNALKFTPAGEVQVEVRSETALLAGGEPAVKLTFVVRDTGIGIAAEKQSSLFQPFSQVDNSSTRKYGGAGLGLAISRSLVRLMGGDITVTSTAGAGAAFTFHIVAPLLEPARPLPPLPARHAAVVSANLAARRHYLQLLTAWGLEVTAAENLPALPVRRDYGVVVVDVALRDASLWPELLRPRADLRTSAVVGLLAVGLPAATRDELRGSFRALLKKPVRDSLFHTLLREILKN